MTKDRRIYALFADLLAYPQEDLAEKASACLDLLRQRTRRKTDSLDALLEGEGPALERILGSSPGPAAALEAADLGAKLLAALPEEQRLALVLRETQGLRYDEIARVMDCSVDSAKARLRRARESLQAALRHFLSG